MFLIFTMTNQAFLMGNKQTSRQNPLMYYSCLVKTENAIRISQVKKAKMRQKVNKFKGNYEILQSI